MTIDPAAWLRREIGEREASTRAIALVRIGLAIVLLSEWGDALIFIRDTRPVSVAIGLSTLLAGISLLAGFHARASAVWAAASTTGVLYVFGHVQGREDFVHHHTHALMIALWLLALTPCGASYSVDRLRAVRRSAPPAERGFVWAQSLLVVHVSTIYLWSAFEKRWIAFLNGARLEQLYLSKLGTSELPESALFHPAMVAASWGVIAAEIFIGLGIWFRRTRHAAIAIGIAFHLVLYYLLPVSTFSAMMIVLYLAALDPDDVHRWIDEMSGAQSPQRPAAS